MRTIPKIHTGYGKPYSERVRYMKCKYKVWKINTPVSGKGYILRRGEKKGENEIKRVTTVIINVLNTLLLKMFKQTWQHLDIG